MSDLERVTVSLIPRASAALAAARTLTGGSKTDTVNRALQLYAYAEQVTAAGGRLLVEQNGETSEIKLL